MNLSLNNNNKCNIILEASMTAAQITTVFWSESHFIIIMLTSLILTQWFYLFSLHCYKLIVHKIHHVTFLAPNTSLIISLKPLSHEFAGKKQKKQM